MNLSMKTKNRFTDIENTLVVAMGGGVEEELSGNLGFADANY